VLVLLLPAWLPRRRGAAPEHTIAESAKPLPGRAVERAGYAPDVPRGGINEYTASTGAATQTDRNSLLTQLFEAYLACPWSWACVNAIARTVTAGGLVTDWDTDTGEGDQRQPDKPDNVLALENLIAFTNPDQDIRQLMRNLIIDLLIFGDGFLEVSWWGKTPIALWNLDSPSTTPTADEHGQVTGYVQVTDYGLRAEFKPTEVIHFSLDSPRSGVFGISPTHAALLPITSWLFWASCGKETARKGLPPNVHADFPAGTQQTEMTKWHSRYMRENVGPRNIGSPIMTKGGAHLAELQAGKITDILASKDQARDEIISTYGVPPAQVSIIESGNLGGGTGEEQRVTYKVDTCQPVAQTVMEKLNFKITMQGFGVDGWHLKFRDVDYRASQVIEQNRDMRVRNGTWTVNKARADAGEPPVDGGDDAVIIDRQQIVLVRDLARASDAGIAAKGGMIPPGPPGVDDPDQDRDGQDQDGGQDKDNQDPQAGGKPGDPGGPPTATKEQWARFQTRLREAYRRTRITEGKKNLADAVHKQLSRNFPPSSIQWVHNADWTGPAKVPMDQVDTSDQEHWNATHQQGRVDRMVTKLHKRHAAGKELKPAVLVQRPGSRKLLIADGHHRYLAYEQDGKQYVWAFTGTVTQKAGKWDDLALSQKKQGK